MWYKPENKCILEEGRKKYLKEFDLDEEAITKDMDVRKSSVICVGVRAIGDYVRKYFKRMHQDKHGWKITQIHERRSITEGQPFKRMKRTSKPKNEFDSEMHVMYVGPKEMTKNEGDAASKGSESTHDPMPISLNDLDTALANGSISVDQLKSWWEKKQTVSSN